MNPGTAPDRCEGDDADDRSALIAPRLARAIVAAVFCGVAVRAMVLVLDSGRSAGEIALAVALLSGELRVQYSFSRSSTNLRARRAYAALAVQACLVYLPLTLFRDAWVSQPPFLAGSVLLVLPPPVAWPVFAAIVAGTAAAEAATGGVPLDVAYIAVDSTMAGLFVYGLTRLARLVTALHEARDELATTAVAHERLRFARDLHDLLGLRLSAIAPKGELTLRLLQRDPSRARQEISEILAISRRALDDVRSVAGTYRERYLDDEAKAGASMLAASEMDLRVELDHREQPPRTRTTLAAVLGATLPVTARLPERPAEAAAEPKESVPHIATSLAGALVVAVLCGFFLKAVLRLLDQSQESWEIALNIGYPLAALVLQLVFFSRPGARLRSPTTYLLLGVQALLVYLPLVQFQGAWWGTSGFVAGSALLALRPATGWSVLVAFVASVAVVQVGFGVVPPQDVIVTAVLTVDGALVTYGLTWMARTVRQLQAVRLELAQAAVAQERLRFAQDAHDLLGLSLSAITLKCDLACRLLLRDPARAGTVLAEVLEITRHALAEVRSVASGYHELSLEEECRTAASLLTTAGLDVRMDLDDGDLLPEVSTVLATVLREGVTNVLRHSKGERCEITIRNDEGGVRLRIVNDGVTEPAEGVHWGSGIRNLSGRVAALGGALTAEFRNDARFELCARIPGPPVGPAKAS